MFYRALSGDFGMSRFLTHSLFLPVVGESALSVIFAGVMLSQTVRHWSWIDTWPRRFRRQANQNKS